MSVIITAFERSPDRGRGLARDMRVRWALEEVGVAYDVQLLSFEAMKQPAHLARNPFGQIPTYEDGALVIFESGAIILHIAQQHRGLLPEAPAARARAVSWMFAAVGTVEPPIIERSGMLLLESEKSWRDERLALVDERIRTRLTELSHHLRDQEWLDGAFSAADIMMVHVIQRLEGSGLLEEHANLTGYIARAKARPAFERAFAAQRAVYVAATSA